MIEFAIAAAGIILIAVSYFEVYKVKHITVAYLDPFGQMRGYAFDYAYYHFSFSASSGHCWNYLKIKIKSVDFFRCHYPAPLARLKCPPQFPGIHTGWFPLPGHSDIFL